MTRYIKQRDKYSCGPVAVFNSLRWAGADVSSSYVYDLKDKCKLEVSEEKQGVEHYDFDRVLREEGIDLFRVDLILKPRMSEIETHLQTGGALVLNYAWEEGRHYTLVTEESETGKTFEMVNEFSKRPTVVKVRRKTFVERCLSFRNDITAKAWLLTKV